MANCPVVRRISETLLPHEAYYETRLWPGGNFLSVGIFVAIISSVLLMDVDTLSRKGSWLNV